MEPVTLGALVGAAGVVLGSALTVLGTWLSARQNSNTLRKQLEAEALERGLDRKQKTRESLVQHHLLKQGEYLSVVLRTKRMLSDASIDAALHPERALSLVGSAMSANSDELEDALSAVMLSSPTEVTAAAEDVYTELHMYLRDAMIFGRDHEGKLIPDEEWRGVELQEKLMVAGSRVDERIKVYARSVATMLDRD